MEQQLLFDTSAWLVWLAPFAGVLAAGITKRRDPVIEGDRVLRHDLAARIEHWTHGIGTAALLVTGALLGTFFRATNTLMAPARFKEHLPTRNAIEYTKRHYGLLLGSKKYTMPPEAKYFESEKMAFLLALGATALIILTGLVKVAAHAISVPAGLMALVTPLHDIAAVAMLLFFLAHVFFAAILPMGWPMLVSMFTGYVSLEHAKAEHAGWLEELQGKAPAKKDFAA